MDRSPAPMTRARPAGTCRRAPRGMYRANRCRLVGTYRAVPTGVRTFPARVRRRLVTAGTRFMVRVSPSTPRVTSSMAVVSGRAAVIGDLAAVHVVRWGELLNSHGYHRLSLLLRPPPARSGLPPALDGRRHSAVRRRVMVDVS